MIKKILVALDRSELSDLVFDTAVSIAQKQKANLLLLHVTPLIETVFPGGDIQSVEAYLEHCREMEVMGLELIQSFADRIHTILQTYAEQAPSAELDTEISHQFGDAGRTICSIACDWEADLIVIGRRGRSGATQLLMGSVSNYVMHHAPCSVMVVHPKKESAENDSIASRKGASKLSI